MSRTGTSTQTAYTAQVVKEALRYKAERDQLAACLRAILYHDERGQGIGYAEAMAHAVKLLAALEGGKP
jgi:hypothetical protein